MTNFEKIKAMSVYDEEAIQEYLESEVEEHG